MAVSDALRREILSGTLPPGSLLLQAEIAERFGVSRIPIRDALLKLAVERLVTIVPGKGAKVIELSEEELSEIFDLRIYLECDLLRRAMTVATAEYLTELEYALQRSNLEAGRPDWAAGDWSFHSTLYAPARRRRQSLMVEELRDICTAHIGRYDRLRERTSAWISHHEDIVHAVIEGDSNAAIRLLELHLESARSFLLSIQPSHRSGG
jgi:DNA-binding GntR family transcriptional regulator